MAAPLDGSFLMQYMAVGYSLFYCLLLMLCVTFTGLLCSSSSTTITSIITATQYTPMIRSSTNQTLSESCDTTTVHTTSSVITKPSTEINPSQISHSKQGKVNNVLYVRN